MNYKKQKAIEAKQKRIAEAKEKIRSFDYYYYVFIF